MFLQDNSNAWSYVLFELRVTMQNSSADTFAIYPDEVNRTKDLRNRGEKTVLVVRSDAEVSRDVSKNYVVQPMDPLLQKFCDLYTSDLAERLGLDEEGTEAGFKREYFTPVLLNPIFGLPNRIVNTGLMTAGQCARARRSKSSF